MSARGCSRARCRAAWTHEAHLGACLWLVRERPDLDLDLLLPGIIRSYNESVGGVNDDTQGYHDTITRACLAGVRTHLSSRPGEALADSVNALLASDTGRREWPLRFWSRALLFSVEARRGWVEPDLAPLAS